MMSQGLLVDVERLPPVANYGDELPGMFYVRVKVNPIIYNGVNIWRGESYGKTIT